MAAVAAVAVEYLQYSNSNQEVTSFTHFKGYNFRESNQGIRPCDIRPLIKPRTL